MFWLVQLYFLGYNKFTGPLHFLHDSKRTGHVKIPKKILNTT